MIGKLRRLVRRILVSFWFWPFVFIYAGWWLAGFIGVQTVTLPVAQLAAMKSSADAHAVAILTMIAAASITIVTFVFSTLMVVLQLASSQLSPRILRRTIREGRAQMVMAIMVGTFSFATHALLLIYAEQDPGRMLLFVMGGIALMLREPVGVPVLCWIRGRPRQCARRHPEHRDRDREVAEAHLRLSVGRC